MSRTANKNLLSLPGRFNTLFKGFILFGVCVIGAVFVYYTNDVINDIRENEAEIARTYTKIWQLVASDSVSGPVTSVLFDEIILKSNFPIVVTDSAGHPLFWKELPGIPPASDDPKVLERVAKHMSEMKADQGEIPIYIDSVVIYKLYYGDTALVNKLRMIPVVEMALVVGFIVLSLVGFQFIRRSEQRSIWVGMAKETAHQLGTPISSLLGWLNLLKTGEYAGTFTPEEVYCRIGKDLMRLETVANRFGRIGSVPKLEKMDVNRLTGEVVEYFQERLPHQGEGVQIHFVPGDISEANINSDLYNWVVENVLKNSLEAVDSKTGVITVKTYPAASGKTIAVEISDDGRGIARRDARRIFKPGYTTKRRGWGLGLSLARRIIHDYHKGSLVLAASEPGRGATFIIYLPAV